MAGGRRDRPTVLVCDDEPVVRMLRRRPGTAETPVIMLTARAQASDREAMNLAGADHYLTKPFSPIGLASLVEDVLGT